MIEDIKIPSSIASLRKLAFKVPEIENCYYFDSINGNDDNDGKSVSKPFRSLLKIPSLLDKEPCKLLFKKGCLFDGNLVINDSAIIDSYGDGNKPIFTSNRGSIISIHSSNVSINNVEITGYGAIRGIELSPKEKGIISNILIQGCYIHDINWNWIYRDSPFSKDPDDIDVEIVCNEFDENGERKGRYFYRYHGGIIGYNEIGPSTFDNIFIINNIVCNVARTGITIYSKWADKPGIGYGYNKFINDENKELNYDTGLGYFKHHNIVCINNYVECVGGDGIVISSCDNSYVANNISFGANYLGRTNYWNAAIWVYDTDKCLFENNFATNTYKRHGGEDAQGFDIDNCCNDVYLTNNISYGNEGGGMLICNLATKVVLRNKDGTPVINKDGTEKIETITGKWGPNYVFNNLFAFNGNAKDLSRAAMLTIAREASHAQFNNNLVVLNDLIGDQSIINTEDLSTKCYENCFKNNRFIANKNNQGVFTTSMMINPFFKNNYYYGVNPFVGEEHPFLYSINERPKWVDKIAKLKIKGDDAFERFNNAKALVSLINKTIKEDASR